MAEFTCRIKVCPVILLAVGALAFLIAWMMVGFQPFQAARARPVERGNRCPFTCGQDRRELRPMLAWAE